MPYVPAFHSADAEKDPPDRRVYHDNSTCILGRQIGQEERRPGTGGYHLCPECEHKKKQGR